MIPEEDKAHQTVALKNAEISDEVDEGLCHSRCLRCPTIRDYQTLKYVERNFEIIIRQYQLQDFP